MDSDSVIEMDSEMVRPMHWDLEKARLKKTDLMTERHSVIVKGFDSDFEMETETDSEMEIQMHWDLKMEIQMNLD